MDAHASRYAACRFEKITETYRAVAADTKDQLTKETAIMDGYIDFRFALKEAEVMSRELMDKQTPTLQAAQAALAKAQTGRRCQQGRARHRALA